MITTSAFRRPLIAAILPAALAVLLAAPVTRADGPAITEDEIFRAKCTRCHAGHRVYQISPEEIRPVVERMRKMNPDWITQVESDHVANVIAKLLDDPGALRQRTAWADAVERGAAIFRDGSLGTTGKSCASCHEPGRLKNIEDAFPKFDPNLKRFVDIQEAINIMIKDKQKGTPFPPNDPRYFDLLAYLKSLK